jgi:hypothetical protein
MRNSKEAIDYVIECAREVWESLREEMLNDLAGGIQKNGRCT